MEADLKRLVESSKKFIGVKQVCRGLAEKKVQKVILSEDADKPLKEKVLEACFHAAVEVVNVPSKLELGEACGIDVAAAVVGILR